MLGAGIRIILGSAPRWLLPYAVGLVGRDGLGDGRRLVHRRAAAGGDGLQGRRPAPDRRPGRRVRRGRAPATRRRCSSPAWTPCSPASPTRSPRTCPTPARPSRRSRTTGSTSRRRWCSRLDRRAASSTGWSSRGWCARTHRREHGGGDDDAAGRGAVARTRTSPRRCDQPPRPRPRADARGTTRDCGSAGPWPPRPRRGLILVAVLPRLAVAQRRGRVPAGVRRCWTRRCSSSSCCSSVPALVYGFVAGHAAAAPPTCRR